MQYSGFPRIMQYAKSKNISIQALDIFKESVYSNIKY